MTFITSFNAPPKDLRWELRKVILDHKPSAIYSTCRCGTEINSLNGWVDHIFQVVDGKI